MGFVATRAPVHDQRHMMPPIDRQSFTALQLAAVFQLRHDRPSGAVVAGKNNDGILIQPEVFQLPHDLSYIFIQIRNHIPEIGRVLFETTFHV
ncbi:hypothetical protein D3C86_1927380 [compost metagenome]